MTDTDDIVFLKKEIEAINGALKGFHDAHIYASDDTTNHIVYIYRYLKMINEEIENIYDVIGPMEEKIFPAVREARRKLWSIMDDMSKRPLRDDPSKSD